MMPENNNFTVVDLFTIDWADDYHADRLMWLHENLSRASFYHDIKENGADGIFELIGDMQDVSRHDFASYVYYNFLGGTKWIVFYAVQKLQSNFVMSVMTQHKKWVWII